MGLCLSLASWFQMLFCAQGDPQILGQKQAESFCQLTKDGWRRGCFKQPLPGPVGREGGVKTVRASHRGEREGEKAKDEKWKNDDRTTVCYIRLS